MGESGSVWSRGCQSRTVPRALQHFLNQRMHRVGKREGRGVERSHIHVFTCLWMSIHACIHVCTPTYAPSMYTYTSMHCLFVSYIVRMRLHMMCLSTHTACTHPKVVGYAQSGKEGGEGSGNEPCMCVRVSLYVNICVHTMFVPTYTPCTCMYAYTCTVYHFLVRMGLQIAYLHVILTDWIKAPPTHCCMCCSLIPRP